MKPGKFGDYVRKYEDLIDEDYLETIDKQQQISRVLDGMESDDGTEISYTTSQYNQDKEFFNSKELIMAKYDQYWMT
jgi:hypothetical protein